MEQSAPDDFWRQVKHTVRGVAIAQDQVDLIITAIRRGLELEVGDYLLDLCCGNGALSNSIFDLCSGGVGVDFSERLIEVARMNFERPKMCNYVLSDVEEYVESVRQERPFTKALWFGAMQLLPDRSALAVLTHLRRRFPEISRVFIGDIPDKDRLHDFYDEGAYVPGLENDHESPIGIWRTESDVERIANKAGWESYCERMPANYHAAHYRYNAVLTPSRSVRS